MRKINLKNIFNVSETTAVMCRVIAALWAAFMLCGLLVIFLIYPFEGPLPYAAGLTAGCLLSAVKLILLEKALNKSLDMEKTKAQGYAGLHAALRYFLTVAVLLLVVLAPKVFGLVGAIIGLFILQISAFIAKRILKKKDETV